MQIGLIFKCTRINRYYCLGLSHQLTGFLRRRYTIFMYRWSRINCQTFTNTADLTVYHVFTIFVSTSVFWSFEVRYKFSV